MTISLDVNMGLGQFTAGASVAAAPSIYGGLNGYWGQYGSEPLRNYCDSGIEYVTLSFVNLAPENDPSGYPGTNFAGHCWAGVYKNKDGVESKLLSECQNIKRDIPYCQDRGVKVLLSIGGDYTDSDSNYKVTTENKGRQFADFLYGAFGPYNPKWDGPRPFDLSDTEHSAVDGFDFDIEAKLDNKPYIAMIEALRAHSGSLTITGAPQCPTSDAWFYMKDMISKAAFDALFIQFYNNPACDTLEKSKGDKFNYDEWENIVENSAKSQTAKLYVGLPASPSSATNGYITPKAVKDLVCKLKNKKHFAGISLWDLTRGESWIVDGKTYNEHIMDALRYGCSPVPSSTSTVMTSTTTTSTTTTSTSTSTMTTSTRASTTTSPSSITTASVPTSTDVTTPVSSGTLTPTVTSTPLPSSETDDIPTPSSTPSTNSPSTSDFETSTDVVPTPSSTPGSPSTSDSESSTLSTGVIESTTTSTSDRIPSATLTFATTRGWNTTITRSNTEIVLTTTLVGTDPGATDGPSSTEGVEMTTSTHFTTQTRTITKCPPYVIDCPAGGYVTTETIPLYTTVCPVTKTGGEAKPAKPTKSANKWSTSTVYTTRVHTVTKCPPEVKDCPADPHKTTETIPLYTTVVPVTEGVEGPKTTGSKEHVGKPGYEGSSNKQDIGKPGHEGSSDEEEAGKPSHEGSSSGGHPVNPNSPITVFSTLITPAKPTVSAQPIPISNGTTPVVPVGSSGGCQGAGCPKTPIKAPVGDSPATAGAVTVAVGLGGLAAMVVLQVFAL